MNTIWMKLDVYEIEIVYDIDMDRFEVFYYEDHKRYLAMEFTDFKKFITERLREGFTIIEFQEGGEFKY